MKTWSKQQQKSKLISEERKQEKELNRKRELLKATIELVKRIKRLGTNFLIQMKTWSKQLQKSKVTLEKNNKEKNLNKKNRKRNL